MYYDRIQTKLGPIVLAGNDDGLCAILFEDEEEAILRWMPDAIQNKAKLRDARDQLREYFAGKRTKFDLRLNPEGTPFQKEVWQALLRIPFGKTSSYSELARGIGRPNAARAVGAANGRNPLAIIVPCHRVIGNDGTLVGYAGGMHRKKWLLEHEGAIECHPQLAI